MREKRRQRVASFLRDEIAAILQREVRDPRIGLVSVTKVEATDDLKEAVVHVSIYGTESEQRTSMRGVVSATKHIQNLLAPRLHFRHAPVLRFVLDPTIERTLAMNTLIEKALHEDEEAARARAVRSEEPPAPGKGPVNPPGCGSGE